jgi:hypothetical protein
MSREVSGISFADIVRTTTPADTPIEVVESPSLNTKAFAVSLTDGDRMATA